MQRHFVVASYREDTSWIQENFPNITVTIYQSQNASAQRPLSVEMGETAAYLQFIVDHYDSLPGALDTCEQYYCVLLVTQEHFCCWDVVWRSITQST